MKSGDRSASRRKSNQMSLPGFPGLMPPSGNSEGWDRRIPHKKILLTLQASSEGAEAFAEIYRREVLPVQTRTIRLLGRKCPARIIHSLLGYEVQASFKRIQCPDMVTARYLKLFSELGCHSIRLPYDPTITARLVPRFESVLGHITMGVTDLFPGDIPLRRYVLRKISAILRKTLSR
jgi:hypothetical protein